MEQESNQGSAGEMMILGLIDHADRLGRSAQSTQSALTEQIQELAQLQQWTVNAASELQKQADATVKDWSLSGCGCRVPRRLCRPTLSRLFTTPCGCRVATSDSRL